MMPFHVAAAAEVVPPFSGGALLDGWKFPFTIWAPVLVVAALYLVGYARIRSHPRPMFSRYRPWCFIGGLAALLVSLDGPMDRYADVDLAVHMTQHIMLLYLVAPLIVFGAPLTMVVRVLRPPMRGRYIRPIAKSRAVHVLSSPWLAAAICAADLLASHFTPWYNLSLEHPLVHDLEHLSYLLVGLLLWETLLGADPVVLARAPSQRILALFALMPVMVAIGVVFIVWPHPLYAYYPSLPAPWGVESFVMSRQTLAGVLMWAPSLFVSLAAAAYISVQWFRADERRAGRTGETAIGRQGESPHETRV